MFHPFPSTHVLLVKRWTWAQGLRLRRVEVPLEDLGAMPPCIDDLVHWLIGALLPQSGSIAQFCKMQTLATLWRVMQPWYPTFQYPAYRELLKLSFHGCSLSLEHDLGEFGSIYTKFHEQIPSLTTKY